MSKPIDDGGARERLRASLGNITIIERRPRKPKVPSIATATNLMVLGYVEALREQFKDATSEFLPGDRVLARWSHPVCLTPEEHLILLGHGEYLILPGHGDYFCDEAPGHKILTDEVGRCVGFEGPWDTWRHYLCHHREFLDVMNTFMDCALEYFDAEIAMRRKQR